MTPRARRQGTTKRPAPEMWTNPTSGAVGGGLNKQEFDSWGSFIETISGWQPLQHRMSESDPGGPEWQDLGHGWDGFIARARNGWTEQAAIIAARASRMTDRIAGRMIRHQPEYAVAGHYLDPVAYQMGRPDCFVDLYPVETAAPGVGVVSVAFNASISAAMNGPGFVTRGTAASILISALEAAGYGVDVALIFAVDDRGNGVRTRARVHLKRPDQPPDSGVIATALAHPATVRRAMFRLLENTTKNLHRGYGTPVGSDDTWPAADIDIPQWNLGDSEVEKWIEEKIAPYVELLPEKR